MKVDVDACPKLSEQFSVSSIPTLFVFKNGSKVLSILACLMRQESRDYFNRRTSRSVVIVAQLSSAEHGVQDSAKPTDSL